VAFGDVNKDGIKVRRMRRRQEEETTATHGGVI